MAVNSKWLDFQRLLIEHENMRSYYNDCDNRIYIILSTLEINNLFEYRR